LAADLAALANRFFYDPQTHLLTFQGRMTSAELQVLSSVRAQKWDPRSGTLIFDSDGKSGLRKPSRSSRPPRPKLCSRQQSVPLNPNTGYLITVRA